MDTLLLIDIASLKWTYSDDKQLTWRDFYEDRSGDLLHPPYPGGAHVFCAVAGPKVVNLDSLPWIGGVIHPSGGGATILHT